jgi:hypothetical protein
VEEITTEAELRQLLGEPLPRVAAKDRPALDEIEQVFHHCAKAFMRSAPWDPATWRPVAPPRARIAQVQDRPDESLIDLEHYYGEQQAAALYPRS